VPDQPQRLSPLAGMLVGGDHDLVTAGAPGVVIGERRGLSVVQIAARRGQADAAAAAIERSMGVSPSSEANTVVAGERANALWIGPDRWLVVADDMAEGELDRLLREAVDHVAAVTDQSHARCVFRIAGPQARALLAKGCALDLDPSAFPAGQCAQTMIGAVGALLHPLDGTPTFDLYLPRSYAASFCEWFAESAAEFGCRNLQPAGRAEKRP
jgi:heterotetrameric sarcosine oxidase gamma subunit